MEDDLADLYHLFPEPERSEIVAIAEAARIAARETFGPFRDYEESEFYAADGISPEETWERLAERVAAVGARAVVLGMARADIARPVVADLHRRIFGALFPGDAGRFRRRGEGVTYGIQVGTRDEPIPAVERGTSGDRIARRLDAACSEFNEFAQLEDERAEAHLADLVRPPVKLYCKILSTHPFVDGNARLGFLVLQYALVRVGLICVALPDYEAHLWALGVALRSDGKQSYSELERLIADNIARARV